MADPSLIERLRASLDFRSFRTTADETIVKKDDLRALLTELKASVDGATK